MSHSVSHLRFLDSAAALSNMKRTPLASNSCDSDIIVCTSEISVGIIIIIIRSVKTIIRTYANIANHNYNTIVSHYVDYNHYYVPRLPALVLFQPPLSNLHLRRD